MMHAYFLALFIAAMAIAPGTRSAPMQYLNQARQWERADANGDGKLSRQEVLRMPRLARHFEVIDANHDGAISSEEVRAWRVMLRSRNRAKSGLATTRGADEILRRADRNGDGSLSRNELSQALPRLARRFEQIDANGDGLVTRGELAAWLFAQRGPSRSR